MKDDTVARAVGPETLGRLRLRLTAWYVGTFLGILLLVGAGLLAAVTSRFDAELDASLRDAAKRLAATAQERGVTESVSALVIPDRRLIVFDTAGAPLAGAADSWIQNVVRAAVAQGERSDSHHSADDQVFRAYAFPFALRDGTKRVAVAVADEIEVEDKYASVIATSAAAAIIALILVAVGGWIVMRKSTEPIEQAMTHMRRFMADAAHELRTPLSVIRTRAEVALRRPRELGDYAAALRAIEQESARVTSIVDDLLMLARADAGERPIERERVFLDDIALNAAEGVRTLAERAGVQLAVEQFDESAVIGDAVLLRRVVVILLDNAIKFSRQGGEVRVGVSVTRTSATLTVVDTGIGIAEEHLSHVFERFYRGDAARTRTTGSASEGVGLGLSIAQWIVHEHGGSIRIDSRVGAGTRVALQLPLATSDGMTADATPSRATSMRRTVPGSPLPD